MEEKKTYHKANAIKSGQSVKVIIGATVVSMAFMFAFIALGLPMILTIVLFLGIMFLAIFSFMYNGEYWIDGHQLEEKLTPKLKFMPFLKPQHNFYKWDELDSYLSDSNTGRYGGEQRYLKLVFKGPKRVATIGDGTDVNGKESFTNFLTFFSSLLADDGQVTQSNSVDTPVSTHETVSSTQTETIATPSAKPIKAKAEKSFYEGIWGKVLAIFFLLISITFMTVYFFPELFGGIKLKGTNSWKLWAIVIPGTLYMMKRAFFSSKS